MSISQTDCLREAVRRREERARLCRRSNLSILGKLAILVALLIAPAGGLLSARAQAVVPAHTPDRISGEINAAQVVALKGSVHPLAQARYDIGKVSGDTRINGISIYFKPSPAQQAALDLLLQQQQTPGSPLYHQWLTPAQYASEFGLSANDIGNIRGWLERQGFQIESVSNSGNRISFSGSAAQVENTFQTQLHRYQINGAARMANATPISIPSAIAGMVAGVRNLTEFRPQPRFRQSTALYTTISTPTAHFVTPDDFATIYDVNAQYNAGYTGTGLTIAVVGQSSILASDIANFRSLTGLPASAPTMTLVPNTGTSEAYTVDETESDIDVEWSGAVAKSATINFIYVGNSPNYSVFDALQYAIDEDLAPVISISYGGCEADDQSSGISALNTLFAQANAQGQTILAASGDQGAADCEVTTASPGNPVTVVNKDEATLGAAVDFPGSSPNVTSMGGTEFTEGSGTYWNSTNNTYGGSATGFIPAEVWNDTLTTQSLDAGGGGKSILFTKPTWQTGIGVPSDGARDVPDLSLNASPQHDGYIICSSDADSTSCSNGFADSKGDLNVYGGTSFAAPTFAGLLTLINQQVAPKGQGNINPLIYAIANSSSGGSAFHDVTTGNNYIPCEVGSTGCSPGDTAYSATSTGGQIGYAATTGYDLASGWGSVDEYNLAQAFASQIAGTTGPPSGSFTLSASTPAAVAPSSSTSSTITVTPSGGYTGAVAFTVSAPASLTNSCYAPTNATVTGTPPVTGMITIYTSAAACTSAGGQPFSGSVSKLVPPSKPGDKRGSLGGAALASVLLLGFARKRKRFRSVLLSSVFLGAALLGFVSSGIGCGGSGGANTSTTSNTSASTTAAAGTYVLTVTGTGSGSNSPSNTTPFTLTVQ